MSQNTTDTVLFEPGRISMTGANGFIGKVLAQRPRELGAGCGSH
ncbi:MAG: hypothetical protein ACJAYC_001398 [Halieaceae bacterium]|jgi:hypothetical protein